MNTLNTDFLTALEGCLADNQIYRESAQCWTYGYDNSRLHTCPQAVVFPKTSKQVQQVVAACEHFQVNITARGRGTGTTGAAVPIQSGIVLSFEKMDKIIQLDPINRIAIVEPGVTNLALQQAAQEHNLFWAPDPSSSAHCSIGGNLAVNAAGPRAVKYGTCRENTLGLEAVLGNGELIKSGCKTTKGVVGYDLTRLLIGSEGTLGVITEATLKLLPKAAALRSARLDFKDSRSAVEAIIKIMQQSITPCALEFMDHNALNMIRNYSDLTLAHDLQAMLILELDGSDETIDKQFEVLCAAAENQGLIECSIATNAQQRKALWQTRKALSPALRHVAPNKINEDVVVPISELPALLDFTDTLVATTGINIVNFGHAGNGNLHVNIMHDANDPRQHEQAKECLEQLFEKVLALGGTLSGEHGTGLAKKPYIKNEIDSTSYSLMQQIKSLCDPKQILNPGKL